MLLVVRWRAVCCCCMVVCELQCEVEVVDACLCTLIACMVKLAVLA